MSDDEIHLHVTYATASGPLDFAKYKRPQFEGPMHKLTRAPAAESDDGEMSAENLSDLLERACEALGESIDLIVMTPGKSQYLGGEFLEPSRTPGKAD